MQSRPFWLLRNASIISWKRGTGNECLKDSTKGDPVQSWTFWPMRNARVISWTRGTGNECLKDSTKADPVQ